MKAGQIDEAIALAAAGARILVATADPEGLPHLAAAGGVRAGANATLEVTAWFCPGTLANLEVNPRLSVTVWDPAADRGLQVLGAMERVDTEALLDGFAYGVRDDALPQVERTIVMRPRRVIRFSHAPHTDREE